MARFNNSGRRPAAYRTVAADRFGLAAPTRSTPHFSPSSAVKHLAVKRNHGQLAVRATPAHRTSRGDTRAGRRLVLLSFHGASPLCRCASLGSVRKVHYRFSITAQSSLSIAQLLRHSRYAQCKSYRLTSGLTRQVYVSASATPVAPSNRQVNSRQFISGRRNVNNSRPSDVVSPTKHSGASGSSTTDNADQKDVKSLSNAAAQFPGNGKQNKFRRSGQQHSDCTACGGRGFQIVDEELQSCPVCNGATLEPVHSDDHKSQTASFEEGPSPAEGTPSKGRQKKGGRPLSQAARDKIRATMKGRRWTQEHRRAISESMKGVHNAEHRSRISAAMTARPKVCSYCGEEGHNRRGCPKLHPEKVQSQKETKSTSAKTVVVCSHCKSRGHSRRTCPQLQALAETHTLDPEASPDQLPTTVNTAGKTVRLVKGTQTLARDQHAQREAGNAQDLASATGPGAELAAGDAVRVKSSRDDDEEGSKLRSKCSVCGGTGHNARTCPQVAAAKKQEEEKMNKQNFGSLWGLPGVQEQFIRGGKEKALVFPIPLHVEETVSQAAASVIRAYEAGVKRQKLELLLPQAGTTSAQGSWPGGIRQQAQVAIPSMMEPLLKQLKQHPNLQGRMGADWIDESDCVGAWQNSGLAAVLFPTAETLPQVRQIARVKGPHRLMLIINPQWQMNGQVVSDFGFGKGRADAEKFLGALQDVYCLERIRILGDDLRLLKCYPGNWQVHYTWPNGRGSVLLGVEPTRPSYARLVELLKTVPNTRASRNWVGRFLDINNFKGDSRDSSSPVNNSGYVGTPTASQASPASFADTETSKGSTLRGRLQQMLAEAEQPLPPNTSKSTETSNETQQVTGSAQDGSTQDGATGSDDAAEQKTSVLPRPRKTTKAPNAAGNSRESRERQKASSAKDRVKSSKRISDLSMDQEYNAEMLDRFGSVDSKPTRDLKLDPVLQLVRWRESVFGSRDVLSESRDSVSESLDDI